MTSGGKPSTFVTVTPPGRPDVRLVIGCLPKDVKAGACVRTTLQKKVTRKNPSLLVLSNPCGSSVKNAVKAYEKFHMVAPNSTTKESVPDGWPKAYITIGYAIRFDGIDQAGRKYKRTWPTGRVKLCSTGAMKDVYLFGKSSLGVPSGTALRVDYEVPAHSGRNKWARRWWHPHDSKPPVIADKSGKAARVTGPGLKVNARGIIG
jgi:hypothetical protein